MSVSLSAAVLYADFKRLAEQFRQLDMAGIESYHFDIMDGHFVSDFALSPTVIASMRNLTSKPFEAHLMVERPEQFIEATAKAGADLIIIHAEATLQLRRVISQIRRAGCKVGVALNPTTTPDALSYILPDIDTVLLLASDSPPDVDQLFSDPTLDKIREVRAMADEQNTELTISVEGALTTKTIPACVQAGANGLVIGAFALFQEMDLVTAVHNLRKLTVEPLDDNLFNPPGPES